MSIKLLLDQDKKLMYDMPEPITKQKGLNLRSDVEIKYGPSNALINGKIPDVHFKFWIGLNKS